MTRIVTVDGNPEIASSLADVLPRQWRMRTDDPKWVDAIVLVRPDRGRAVPPLLRVERIRREKVLGRRRATCALADRTTGVRAASTRSGR